MPLIPKHNSKNIVILIKKKISRDSLIKKSS
jgi:hypothetical protein